MRTKELELNIEDIEYPSVGIAYHNERKIKIKNTLPGQKVLAKVAKGKGRIIEIKERAQQEITPLCPVFEQCGGCTYQNINYELELQIKEKVVLDHFEGVPFKYLGIEGTEKTGYRNKMEYSFGDKEKDGELNLGLRKRNSYYETVNTNKCNIVTRDFLHILFLVQGYFRRKGDNFYHRGSHEGSLRHLVIRKGKHTNQILLNLVTTSGFDNSELPELVDMIIKHVWIQNEVVGFLHTVNDSVADVVQSDNQTVVYGQDYYTDTLFDLKFNISPFAFFQTNTTGAERLYTIVKEFVQTCENTDTILDLYCGTGTIGQVLSPLAKTVVGIDLVKEAIEVANENTKLNNITNCKFIAGDVKDVIDEVEVTPNVIVVDPPREGLHPKALKKLIEIGCDDIIYVSCKPTSLARDVAVFSEHGYELVQMKLLDMFPRTAHVEAVAKLRKKK